MLRLRLVNQNLFLPVFTSAGSRLITLLLVLMTFAFNTLDAQSELVSRTVSNTTNCYTDVFYGTYLNFYGLDYYYELSDGALVEYSDGTANFTGTITNNTNGTIIFHIDVTLSGRTFTTPANSPKANNCGNNDTSDWYYYTATNGTLTGAGTAAGAVLTVERAGPSFQLGTGANQTEGAAIFNASGWLTITIDSQPDDTNLVLSGDKGDFNINLSGEALTACDNVTSGGKIGDYEVAGGAFTASTITSVADPSGGTGVLQYMWLKTTDPTLPLEQWEVITGEENATLEPGFIEATTYFLRCSRRQGCVYWNGESNIIAKIINGAGTTCNAGAIEEVKAGNIHEVNENSGVDDQNNVTNSIDEHVALFRETNDQLIVELDETLNAGEQLTVSWKARNYTSSNPGNAQLQILESNDGINFVANTILETNLKTIFVHQTITLSNDAKFIKLVNISADNTRDFDVDAISYNIKTCIESFGSIGNQVWEDLNGNGTRDDGEPGIQGVFVFLEDENGNAVPGVDLTVTDASGQYSFENLPLDNYVVRFATPSGFLPTTPNAGGDDTNDSDASFIDGKSDLIELSNANLDDLTVDAGYVKPVKLVGIVWLDTDEDGLQETTVEGVENVFVTLYDAGDDMIAGTDDDVKYADATTDEQGFYTFTNVIPGKYYVEFDDATLPLGYSYTIKNTGLNDFIDSDADQTTGFSDVFMMTSGQPLSGVDAGIFLTCGFVPSVKIGEAKCEGFPVDFGAEPTDAGYTYFWQFLDDVTNPVVIGESTDGLTDFTWNTPGEKIYILTVTNSEGCSVSLTGIIKVLAAEEAECTTILPVELIDFTANIHNEDQVLLEWATAWEQNNNFFEIQRSTDGDRFQTIGSVDGKGTTELINDYHFLDAAPFYGRNYYRLKQVDFDGTIDFSEVQSTLIDNESLPDVVAYPNPTKDVTTLRVVTPFEADASVEIVNAAGQVLEIIAIQAGTNSQEIDLSKYQPGFYFLNIKYNGFKKLVHRVMKVTD